MKVMNLHSPNTGNAVANQFYIRDDDGTEWFQSYNAMICKIVYEPGGFSTIYLDPVYWRYSKTTSKYRSVFLNESTSETEAKIASGKYILTNLN